MAQQPDGSGQHIEAVSPMMDSSSPQQRHVSQMSEMIDNTPPIPVEHSGNAAHPQQDKAYAPDAYSYFSAPEAVEPHPPNYQYGVPPTGSPPPKFDNVQPYYYGGNGEKGQGQYNTLAEQPADASPAQEQPKILGLRKRTFYIILLVLIAIVLLAVGLGAGLAIGLKKDNNSNNDSDSNSNSNSNGKSTSGVTEPFCKDHPDLCVGGALNSEYFSTKGAFNGSGLALAGESWNKDFNAIFTLYFQHHSGDLRYMQYTKDKKWLGGGPSETLANNVKNGSAISAVAYTTPKGISYNHIFYINKDNKIAQRILANDTGVWKDGPLNKMNLDVYDAPNVGLQACFKGNFYGDADYKKFPTADGKENTVEYLQSATGINLWFPSDESTFQQYAWYTTEEDTWVKVSPWLGKNVYAGVGCYSWGAGSNTYTMMVNKQNVTEIWWKDGNDTMKSTDQHPVNSWTNSSSAIPNVDPKTSLGYTTYLYMQMADQSIQGVNVSYEAERTWIVDKDTFTIAPLGVKEKAISGTHLTATAVTVTENNSTKVKWDSLYVFVQTAGDDITAYARPIYDGEWSKASLEIPQD